jgi:MFS family permease
VPNSDILAPLRLPLFRRIWVASLMSNFGILIMGVGAAWVMTQLTPNPSMVALVQTALSLPIALFSTPAGAVADMFDRRIVGLVSLTLALAASAILAAVAMLGATTPEILLLLCFTIGSCMAMFGPAWQASVSEQVPTEAVPSAVALNGISYNIARSFAPAIGGIIVATAGGVAAFVANAALYVPLIIVLFLWRRQPEPSRLPPEALGRAMISGARYIVNAPAIRIVLNRTIVTGLAGGAVFGLLPLVARDLLHAGAQTYGLLLGAFGMGAIGGALNITRLRAHFSAEVSVRICALSMGVGTALVAVSRWPAMTGFALLFVGAGWTASATIFNVGVQLSAPRWVAGRALAAFQAAISGGIALGSWVWGALSHSIGLESTMLMAAALFLASPALSRWWRMPYTGGRNEPASDPLDDPEVQIEMTARSGPIVVEIEYRVDVSKARQFHVVMQQVQRSRRRNGAYHWSIARDIADPELWTERYLCPTWHDYLRQRSRATQYERTLHFRASEFHIGAEPVRLRRMLERPAGSVH